MLVLALLCALCSAHTVSWLHRLHCGAGWDLPPTASSAAKCVSRAAHPLLCWRVCVDGHCCCGLSGMQPAKPAANFHACVPTDYCLICAAGCQHHSSRQQQPGLLAHCCRGHQHCLWVLPSRSERSELLDAIHKTNLLSLCSPIASGCALDTQTACPIWDLLVPSTALTIFDPLSLLTEPI